MKNWKHPLITGQTTPAQVLVVNFDARGWAIIAHRRTPCVRGDVELIRWAKKVGQQPVRGEPGLQAGGNCWSRQFEQGVWKVKDLAKREETAVKESELVGSIQSSLQ